jgi:hypothetical protein
LDEVWRDNSVLVSEEQLGDNDAGLPNDRRRWKQRNPEEQWAVWTASASPKVTGNLNQHATLKGLTLEAAGQILDALN